ncbi:MAG: phosphoribosyltransferase [Deltaproteobacteria bacterium]|nr:phosphoribosyltransferase [Deltaproteobacteria bacterium]
MRDHAPSYRNRTDAGRRLAVHLAPYGGRDVVVLAIPRGGVPVAVEVAAALGADLDIIVPRKIPIPGNTEAGFGAVTEDGVVVLNEPLVRELGLTGDEIDRLARKVRQEIARRQDVFRAVLPPLPVYGRSAIVIDDGLASGYTMMAAVGSIRKHGAKRVVAAAPVASGSGWELVRKTADDVVCPVVSSAYPFAVANFYAEWYDLDDDEVLKYLAAFENTRGEARP